MWSSTPHWILEVTDSCKTAGTIQSPTQPPTGLLITAFDAATSQYCSWAPNGTAKEPDSGGTISGFDMNGIPEGFAFGALVLIASVATLVGFFYLRKPKSIELNSISV